MTRHYLGLQDASVLATRDLLLSGRAIADLMESEAMGAVVGPAGLGKTFAIEHALSTRDEQVITLTFEARPTMRLVADRLLVAMTGAPGSGTRFAMTDQLLNRLSDRRRLVVIGETQNLNRDCFEYLRHLHDDPSTRFALLFDGGDGCWEVLAREPMLRSRIYRRVAFRALSDTDVLSLIPSYHPIYVDADPELLVLINDKAANGRLRSWAAFTQTASLICRGLGAERIDKAIARNAISQLATAREPSMLAVSIVPGVRSETEVIWAILQALGKRIDQLTNYKVWWIDAERWLTAHGINEIAVLYAQHLDEHMTDELKEHAGRRLGIALVLIYGRPPRAAAVAPTDLDDYLARERDPPSRGDRAERWPQVPRSHPSRFRYDCWRELDPEQFARVEQRLFGCMTMLGGWCRSTDPTRSPGDRKCVSGPRRGGRSRARLRPPMRRGTRADDQSAPEAVSDTAFAAPSSCDRARD